MGRPPSNGGPSFRFNHSEVAEMEAILQAHNAQMPTREVLDALAEKFSSSAERSGKVVVQMKQIWNWFQNRRYAIRAKAGKPPAKLTVSTPQNNSTTVKNVPLAPQVAPSTTAPMRSMPQNTKITAVPPVSVQDSVKNVSESQMEFEARSASDGAWYDVSSFLSHRSVETGDPEVLVRFAGFGPEEDEWINVRKHIRQRSLPCESSECIVVLPGDLILCFQEGKEQALYYDAHILDSQRRRHDIRGCRCRFLVRYDHDQSEEIVPLRKICRRPETDHRLQQLDAESGKVKQQKTGGDALSDTTTKCSPVIKTAQKEQKLNQTDEKVSCPVALDPIQAIPGSQSHSAHISMVNQNSELTQPLPTEKIFSDSIATQVLPATEIQTTIVEKVNKISELTQSPIAKTGSDSIVTQVLATTENHATLVEKVNTISELTQLPTENIGSDSITTQVLPATESHATIVEKVNPISQLTQSPIEKTGSNNITQVLPATESHATIVEKVNQISELSHLPVADTGSDTVAMPDVGNVSQTSEMIQLPHLADTETPLAETEIPLAETKTPLAETETDTVAIGVVPAPENHAAAVVMDTSTQNSLPVPSQ